MGHPTWTQTLGLGDNGMAAGCTDFTHGSDKMFLWSSSQGLQYIDAPNYFHINPMGINNQGVVVGVLETNDNPVVQQESDCSSQALHPGRWGSPLIDFLCGSGD